MKAPVLPHFDLGRRLIRFAGVNLEYSADGFVLAVELLGDLVTHGSAREAGPVANLMFLVLLGDVRLDAAVQRSVILLECVFVAVSVQEAQDGFDEGPNFSKLAFSQLFIDD